jgi:hypothetical protein
MSILPRRRAPRKGPKIRRIPPYGYKGAEAKPTPAAQRRGSYEASAPEQQPAQQPAQAPQRPGASTATTVAAVLGGLGITFLILYATGFFDILSKQGTTDGVICPSESGYVKCGYCSEDAATSGNPNAGQCRYCPTGTTCQGSICGKISCVPTAGGTSGGGGAGYCTSDADCRGFGSRNCDGSSLVRCGSDRLCHCCYAVCPGGVCSGCVPCSTGCDVNSYCERGACVFKVGGPTNA